jgi:hypothetical protein
MTFGKRQRTYANDEDMLFTEYWHYLHGKRSLRKAKRQAKRKMIRKERREGKLHSD